MFVKNVNSVYIIERGGYTNIMLQYLFASRFVEAFDGFKIYGKNSHRLDWVYSSSKRPLLCPSIPNFDLPYADVVEMATKSHCMHLKFRGVPLHYNSLPDYAKCNILIPRLVEPTYLANASELLVNVRGDEILSNCHPDYGPTPITFIRNLIEGSGLNPVFLGQLGDDYYSRALRAAFPDALFVPSRGAARDFEALRSAVNLVPAVSTFSWLASWLSSAQTIHIPVLGMFNPMQRKDAWFLPHNDQRYKFYEFPVRKWNASSEQIREVISGASHLRLLSRDYLETIYRKNLVECDTERRSALTKFKRSLFFSKLLRPFEFIEVDL